MTVRRQSTWLPEILLVTVLMLLPLLFWWRLWSPDPADRAVLVEGDFTSQYYPLQLFAARELAAGRLPTWNPYLNAGQPALADIQTGAFYPLNLLPNLVLSLFDLPYGLGMLTAQVIIHFSLASLFTYLFVRRLARRAGARPRAARFAAAVSALTFSYAGYLTSFPVQQLTILETSVWLPCVLLFLDRAYHTDHPGPQVVLAGVSLACALLAGHPQTALYLVYATVAYGFFLMAGRQGERWASRALPLALTMLLGFGIAAVQLVPTFAFISRSTRSDLTYDATASGFSLIEASHLLYPGYFGGSPQYVGILPLVLAAASVFVVRARRQVIFWLAVAALSFVLAFGGNTFLYSFLYLAAPGFGSVRNQERVIYLFSFAVSVAAGYGALVLVHPLQRALRTRFQRFARGLGWVTVAALGFTALLYFGYLQGLQQDVAFAAFEGVLRHQVLLLLMVGGALLLFSLRRQGQPRQRWRVALTLGLIALNLFTINWQFNLATPSPGGPFPQTGLVAFLQQQPGIFRISSTGYLPGGSSAGAVYGIEDITANTPLRLSAFQQFQDRVWTLRQLQLLNVHYVVDTRDLDPSELEPVYEEGGVKVYRLLDPFPRAWIVHDAVALDDEETLRLLNTGEFDPRVSAIVSADIGGPALDAGGQGVGSAQIIESRPGRLLLEVSSNTDGLLVVSQPFYPGWRAEMDGTRVEIYRVNYLLQGIPVPKGTHRVELTFHLSLWPGLVSLMALAASAVILAFGHRVAPSRHRARASRATRKAENHPAENE